LNFGGLFVFSIMHVFAILKYLSNF